ncbi:MAG TPA: prolyl oligopeptidase family serine peptidase [Armatimonadota bacterium]|nr:prolyl oligopeptidase family serine peptidase [Armatimonadota bacterium]HPO71346.1 prolyl oligopeptidase family serine peptidase [Armatimonadota bacterium]HPT98363.1 prolyl oligopeptidase family serine peptidase [Armatimonadota bacterium]
MKSLSRELSRVPEGGLGEDQRLAPLFPAGCPVTVEAWEEQRASLRREWDRVLGKPSFESFDQAVEVVGRFEQPEYRGTLVRQPTGPHTRQLLLLMEPARATRSPRPGAVVPFYHPDAMAGYDLEKGEPIRERPVVQFGRHLVQQGYVVVCSEAFPFNTVPHPGTEAGFAWWHAGAKKLLQDNPQWTGMGKLAWDASRALDFLLEQPDVDPERILMIGHSLGGKIAFYAGVLDERVRAVIGSDFGIGWSFTNWDAPWYLGEQIHHPEFPLAHHQLLALLAPRSFLLIGGEADRVESWQYLKAAQEVYRLYGREDAVGHFYHGTGHSPTPESLEIAYRWLAEQFGLPEEAWTL